MPFRVNSNPIILKTSGVMKSWRVKQIADHELEAEESSEEMPEGLCGASDEGGRPAVIDLLVQSSFRLRFVASKAKFSSR